jgi:hypothetical protein
MFNPSNKKPKMFFVSNKDDANVCLQTFFAIHLKPLYRAVKHSNAFGSFQG